MERKEIQNSFWLIYDKIFRLTGVIVFNLLLANYLGASFTGEYHFIVAFGYIFYAISLFGLDAQLMNELIVKKYSPEKLLVNSIVIRFFLGVILYLLLIAVAFFFNGYSEINLNLLLIIGIQLFFQPFQILATFFDSKVESKKPVIIRNISVSFSIIVRIILVIYFPNIKLILLAYILEPLIEGLILFIFFQSKNIKLSINNYDSIVSKYLLAKSWPLAFSSIFYVLYSKCDQVMLGFLVDKSQLGNYSLAVRFSELSYFLPVAFVKSIFPSLVALREEKEKYYKLLQKYMNWMFRISLFIALIMLCIPNDFFIYILGQEMTDVGNSFKILMFGAVFVYMGNLSHYWYIAEGYQKLSLFRTSSGLVLNIILNLILIPFYGILGAAIATLITKSYVGYFANLFNKKTHVMFSIQTKSFFYLFKWN